MIDHPFVVFADDFGRHPSSAQHLFAHLPRRHPLVWVNTVGLRAPQLSLGDAKRALSVLGRWIGPGREEAEAGPTRDAQGEVVVIAPAMSPGPPVGLHRRFNRWSLGRGIRATLAERGLPAPIVVTTLPITGDLVGDLGEVLHVYYCVDDYTQWPGGYGAPLRERERDLLARVDGVMATSRTLHESRIPASGLRHYFPHGVDLERFAMARSRAPHALLADLPRPLAGYVGLLDGRHDFELWNAIVRACPEWNFVFVGPRQVENAQLRAHERVHFVDAVAYEEVPSVLGSLDVALLPYLLEGAGASINPLKAKEILAAGVPLVATPLPELRAWPAVLTLASDAEDFARALGSCPPTEDAPRAERRARFLAESTWSHKAREMETVFEDWMRRKESARG